MTKKTQTAIAKATAAAANAVDVALTQLREGLHSARVAIEAGVKKANETRTVAVNRTIEAMQALDVDAGDIRDKIVEVFDAAVEAGDLEKSTAKAYAGGLRFALDRRVMWSPNLHSTEAQINALRDAGKPIPKSLEKKAAELDAKAEAKREAKNSKAHVASDDTVVKALAKALADARTLGKAYAADILDVIHSIKPDWKEPTAE